MRMRVLLLVWSGLMLTWLGAAVFGWGNAETGSAQPLVQIRSASDLVPAQIEAQATPEYYLGEGHLLVLIAVTALSVLLPLRAKPLRIVAGLAYLAVGGYLGYTAWSGDPPAEVGTMVGYVVAGALVLAGLFFFADQRGAVGIVAGVAALAGAAWNTHAVVAVALPDDGRPGLGAVCLTLGYVLVAAGSFAALGDHGRRSNRRA
ncbi:hypothetical protein [Ruania halotolerans]|uniref:hypothetical protein n=1 Tax=Ruania halotolerans TaxID=2897773 RepID=UPI001E3C65A3|nr:hypothetical protein [Ruania halotolerans]UFU05954.1 hypothetical protein LQF10_16225 [Ruania halotolerans]